MNYENATFIKKLWLTYDEDIKSKYNVWTDHVEVHVFYDSNILFKFYCYEKYIIASVFRNDCIVESRNCHARDHVITFCSEYMSGEDQYQLNKAYEDIKSGTSTNAKPPEKKGDSENSVVYDFDFDDTINEMAESFENPEVDNFLEDIEVIEDALRIASVGIVEEKEKKKDEAPRTAVNHVASKPRRTKKQKKKEFTIAAAILLVALLGGFGIYYPHSPINIAQVATDLECGDEYTVDKLAKSGNNVTLTIAGGDHSITPDEVGTLSVEFIGQRGKKTEKETFTYNVVDTTPPTLDFSESPSIKSGLSESEVIKSIKGLKVTDIADGTINNSNVKIEGDYNLNVGGEYDVNLVASDAAGNETTKETTITVDDGSITWDEASKYVGQYVTVRGPLISVVPRMDVNGSPTFINIGHGYPDPDRFQAVIWGEDMNDKLLKKAEDLEENYEYDVDTHIIEIRGLVMDYGGVPEVYVDNADQLIFPTGWKE